MYIDIYPPVIKRGNGKSTVSWTIFPLKPPLKKKISHVDDRRLCIPIYSNVNLTHTHMYNIRNHDALVMHLSKLYIYMIIHVCDIYIYINLYIYIWLYMYHTSIKQRTLSSTFLNPARWVPLRLVSVVSLRQDTWHQHHRVSTGETWANLIAKTNHGTSEKIMGFNGI